MARLTEYNDNVVVIKDNVAIQDVINKLAEYEDLNDLLEKFSEMCGEKVPTLSDYKLSVLLNWAMEETHRRYDRKLSDEFLEWAKKNEQENPWCSTIF